ncbi:MAG: type IV pilus assembly protein PilM [Pseudomonadota bacterium]|nr:type IV pilus assembly protein PilM [Pseudomonadota bacterium]
MFSLKKKNQKLLGVDIGTSAVKVLELSGAGGEMTIEHYAIEPLASGWVNERQIADPVQVGDAVARAVLKSGSRLKLAAACVPSSAVISKVVSMQKGLSDTEREAMVDMEANRFVPYALDEVNIDFQVLGDSRTNPEEGELQVIVCRKGVVDGVVDALQVAGLEPAAIDVDNLALGRVYERLLAPISAAEKELAVLFDFGTATTRLNVFDDGKLAYSRENVFGGRQLIDRVMAKYGRTYDEAAAALRAGDLPESYAQDVLKPFVKTMLQEIQRSLQFFYSSSTHNAVDRLLLSGGCCALAANIADLVEKNTGIPTVVADPFAGMRQGARVDSHFYRETPALLLAGGLALRGI